MPEHRNLVPTVTQRAPVRIALTAPMMDVEVVVADGRPLGRPFLVALECDGELVGWRITLAPCARAFKGGRGQGTRTEDRLRAHRAVHRSISTVDHWNGPDEEPELGELGA